MVLLCLWMENPRLPEKNDKLLCHLNDASFALIEIIGSNAQESTQLSFNSITVKKANPFKLCIFKVSLEVFSCSVNYLWDKANGWENPSLPENG
uniref:Uncharacterized protein n=1 Tax=Tetranychus urticae TaxID=32264 RepID=T1L2U3_TETUR